MRKKEKKQKLKRGQLYWMILEVIGFGIVSGGGTALRPTLPIMMEAIIEILKELKKLDIEEKKVRRSLEKLEKKEIIELVEKGNEVFVYLKDKNNPYVLKYSIMQLLNYKMNNKRWDGRWFLVFFDVPEKQRNKRDYLRKFLNQLGFYRYQKSVYLFPYECESEVKLIKKIVEGAKYVKYIIAEKIEDEDEVKQFFSLQERTTTRSLTK